MGPALREGARGHQVVQGGAGPAGRMRAAHCLPQLAPRQVERRRQGRPRPQRQQQPRQGQHVGQRRRWTVVVRLSAGAGALSQPSSLRQLWAQGGRQSIVKHARSTVCFKCPTEPKLHKKQTNGRQLLPVRREMADPGAPRDTDGTLGHWSWRLAHGLELQLGAGAGTHVRAPAGTCGREVPECSGVAAGCWGTCGRVPCGRALSRTWAPGCSSASARPGPGSAPRRRLTGAQKGTA